MKILHIIANPKPAEEAASKQVTVAFLNALQACGTGIDITTVDLYREPPPFYAYEAYRHFWYPVFQPDYVPSDAEKEAAAYALKQGALFNQADVLVQVEPFYTGCHVQFGQLPSQLFPQ